MTRNSLLGLILLYALFTPFQLWAEADLSLAKVIDGETIELNDGRLIRLLGVIANDVAGILSERFGVSAAEVQKLNPEKMQAEAKNFIQKNILNKRIRLSFDSANEAAGHKDRNGKILAYVWYTIQYRDNREEMEDTFKRLGFISEDKLLNAELLKLGYGFADTQKPFSHQELFLRYEKQAAVYHVGFWRTGNTFYRDILQRGQSARIGSTKGFLSQEAREISMHSARQAFSELIEKSPADYRGYYERSWVGASPFLDIVSEQNVQDAVMTLKLAPFDPKGYLQKHYLQRLLGQDREAGEAYEHAVNLAAKLGLRTTVTELAQSEWQKLSIPEDSGLMGMKNFYMDAIRASLNEDHFLIFMARYKNLGQTPDENIKKIFEEAMSRERFKGYYAKNRELIDMNSPHHILYQTQWALKGFEEPESVLSSMETVN